MAFDADASAKLLGTDTPLSEDEIAEVRRRMPGVTDEDIAANAKPIRAYLVLIPETPIPLSEAERAWWNRGFRCHRLRAPDREAIGRFLLSAAEEMRARMR